MPTVLIVSMCISMGGIEKSLIQFIRLLQEHNCSVDLMLWRRGGALEPELPKDITILSSPSPDNLSVILHRFSLKRILEYFAFKIYKKFKPDWLFFKRAEKEYDIAISYTHEGYSPYYVIDKVSAKKKFMWFHHGKYEITSEKKYQLDKAYFQKFDNIVTVSKANRDMLATFFPEDRDNILVIPNLIDKEKIACLAQEECLVFKNCNGYRISTVGRITKEKGYSLAVETAKVLKNRGFAFRWCFVGDGEERAALEQKVKEYGLSEECIFIGNQLNPYPYIKNADLYVQPSFVESECLSVKEALALEKKVIASDIPALRETLKDKGELCPLKSEAFAQKIMETSLQKAPPSTSNIAETEAIKELIYRDILGE